MNEQRRLLVVSGPSGAGKDTVVKYLMEAHPEIEISVCLLYTSSYFGPLHLAWLAGAALFAAACVFLYRKSVPARRRHIRWLFAALLLADEAFKVACLLAGGNYRASYLPLHLCSINIFLIALHALCPSRLLDNFLYAICIPAALAALLFPTWVSLPAANFMHLHSFTVHILLASYPIMLTAGGDIRPQARYCLLYTSRCV